MNTRLEHANIAVRDIDEMVRFLGNAFPDFKLRGSGVGFLADRRWVHFGNDEFYVALTQVSNEESQHRIQYGNTTGLNHLGFEVGDAAAVRSRLLAAGYEESTVPNSHPHRVRVYFHDREGNDWEFVEYRTDEPGLRNDYEIPDLS